MKKIFLGVSIAALVVCSFGCSKKSVKPVTGAAPVAEVLQSVELSYQRNDATAKDPNTALHCVYVYAENNGSQMSVSKTDMRTSGKCDFAAMKSRAAKAAPVSEAVMNQIVAAVAADNTMNASARDKWDCTAVNVRTTVRQAGGQDCADGKGVANATAKKIASLFNL